MLTIQSQSSAVSARSLVSRLPVPVRKNSISKNMAKAQAPKHKKQVASSSSSSQWFRPVSVAVIRAPGQPLSTISESDEEEDETDAPPSPIPSFSFSTVPYISQTPSQVDKSVLYRDWISKAHLQDLMARQAFLASIGSDEDSYMAVRDEALLCVSLLQEQTYWRQKEHYERQEFAILLLDEEFEAASTLRSEQRPKAKMLARAALLAHFDRHQRFAAIRSARSTAKTLAREAVVAFGQLQQRREARQAGIATAKVLAQEAVVAAAQRQQRSTIIAIQSTIIAKDAARFMELRKAQADAIHQARFAATRATFNFAARSSTKSTSTFDLTSSSSVNMAASRTWINSYEDSLKERRSVFKDRSNF